MCHIPPKPISPYAQRLCARIEARLGDPIAYVEDPDCHGRMAAAPNGNVYYRSIDDFTEWGVIEELRHIEIGWDHPEIVGHSVIKTLLDGISHHQLIFRELEDLGYDQVWLKESLGVRSQLRQMLELDDLCTDDAEHNAVYALVYARAFLDCRDDDLQVQVQAVFTDEELHDAARRGRLVIDILSRDPHLDPRNRGPTIAECTEALGVNDTMQVSWTL